VIAFAGELPAPDAALAAVPDENVWVAESFQAAQQQVYVSPVGGSDGPFALTDGYRSAAKTLAEQRIALAGARLAAMLNSALDSGGPSPAGGDVFINHNGHAYHLATCRYVGRSSQKVSLSEAKAMGRTACGVCKPPQAP